MHRSYVGPYCSSSPPHRWRLEEASGLHSPPARMWWTLNYLADRSYSPPAPNRGLCQALTSTSSQCTHHLTKQIYAYGDHSYFMLSLSRFISLCFVVPSTCAESIIYDWHIFEWCGESVKYIITHWFPSLNIYQSNQWRLSISPYICCMAH